MAVDVISVLREQRLSHTKKSLSFADMHDKRVTSTAERATAVVTGTSAFAGSEHFNEYKIRDLYMRELEAYERKQLYSYYGQPFTPQGLTLWKRVAKAIATSGIEADAYIKAQFTFYHTSFKRGPKPHELTTDAAITRAASIKPAVVVTNNIPASLPTADLFKSCERQMANLMRAQGLTREEVYRKLVLTRLVSFPEVYLNADPAWRQIQK